MTFVTAMGEASETLDWRSLAAPLQTVVFYMGVAQLPRIVEALRSHGAPPERPATIIERATLPGQRLIGGRLDDIGARAQAAHVQAPALLIVGEAATSAAWREPGVATTIGPRTIGAYEDRFRTSSLPSAAHRSFGCGASASRPAARSSARPSS